LLDLTIVDIALNSLREQRCSINQQIKMFEKLRADCLALQKQSILMGQAFYAESAYHAPAYVKETNIISLPSRITRRENYRPKDGVNWDE
jgi:hypothetical protein